LVASRSKDFEKRETLRNLIDNAPDFRTGIIFANRKTEVATLHKSLVRHEYKAVALHGDLDQRARMAALDAFKTGSANLLVASDVAARGLDIPDVSHVFNYDVPFHADDYVHRIGRTGRAGRLGTAYSIVTPHDEKYIAAIEKLIGQEIVWDGAKPHELGPSEASRDDDRPRRGRERSGRERTGRGERGGRRSARDSRETPMRDAPTRDSAERETPERAPRAAEAERTQPRSNRPSAQTQSARRDEPRGGQAGPRLRDRDADNGPAVKGLGDHVPAFLMRPVK
jgi:superfamily II DNA/RNA helicase